MTAHGFNPDDLAEWCGGTWTSRPSAVTGFCQDTRQLKSGDLYVAIRGDRQDGHDFVEDAINKGASGALVGREYVQSGKSSGVPLLAVGNTRLALLDLGAAWRSRLPGSVGGITGSVGKTTVKEMTAGILETGGPTARTRGNWNNDIGLPLSLLTMAQKDRFGVFEAGINHIGEMKQLSIVLQPQWAIITTIGVAHLEFFGSVEKIAEEKSVLAAHVPENGFVVLSADEPWHDFLRKKICARAVTVSLDARVNADFTAKLNGRSVQIMDHACGKSCECEMPLPGEYMVRNALLSVAAARQMGISHEDAAAKISAYKPLKLRWNRTETNGVIFINDAYNANPVSMSAAVRTLDGESCTGRKWAVLGDMGELGPTGPEEHRRIGEVLAKTGIERLVTVGPLAAEIALGAFSAGFGKSRATVCPGLDDAAVALRDAAAGDMVLLKASRAGHLEDLIDLFSKNTLKEG
ncbi:MAG: UDP-N-acetylmuramoyl-tripeptide--D-alanyl-D-alanine ligase [Kiritimatiellia bacterium]